MRRLTCTSNSATKSVLQRVTAEALTKENRLEFPPVGSAMYGLGPAPKAPGMPKMVC